MRLRVGIAAAAVAAYALTLLAAGFTPLRPVLWGADAWAYLSRAAQATCLAAGIVAAVLWWRGPAFPSRLRSRVFLAAGAAPVFFLLRDRWHLLGDGRLWLAVLSESRAHHPHEPLAFAGAALATAGLHGHPASVALRAELWSVALGAVAVGLLALLALRLAGGDRGRWTVLGLCLASGTTQFGFGYVEAYPLLWVVVILYLVLATGAVTRDGSVLAVSAAWGLAAATHGTGFLLFPSLVAVHALRRTGPRLWLGSAVAAAIPIAGAYAGLPHLLAAAPGTTADLRSAASGVAELWAQLRLYPHGAAAWLLDQWNRWSLLAPVSVGLAMAGWVFPRRRPDTGRHSRLAWVLVLAAGGLALPALLLDTEGSRGAAMDWDASAVAAVPLAALAGLGIAPLVDSAAWRKVVVVGLGLAVFGTAGFVGVNATPDAGVRRIEGLMTNPAWTDRTRSLAAESVAAASRQAGRTNEALTWTVRAAELDPGSPRKVTNAAILLAREGDHRRAAALYRALLGRNPANAEAWFRLGRELEALGVADSAQVAYGRAVLLDPRGAAARTHLARLLLAGKPSEADLREAAVLLRESLRLEPDQPGAEEIRRALDRLPAP